MTIPPLELPDNLAACHEVIRRQHAIIVAQQARIEELEARVAELVREVAMLRRELYSSRRERFVKAEDGDLGGNAPVVSGAPPAGRRRCRSMPRRDAPRRGGKNAS
jgi:hypothetical protein